MSKKQSVPSYREHKQSGQAIVTLPDGQGRRHDVLLGKYGTSESRQEYARVLAEWEASGRCLPTGRSRSASLTVNELILAFWEHAKQRYTSSGRELDNFRLSLRPLRILYGQTAAAEFGPKALKVVQQAMANGGWMTPEEQAKAIKRGLPICWCRNVVNRRIVRIKLVFKWAESEELVPGSTYQALRTVSGLPKNRPGIRHTNPIEPATQEQVDRLLLHCRQTLATMIGLQWLAGMRSAEVRTMRTCDIDQSNPGVWLYRPKSHKNAWRETNQQRVVILGPRCIELLRPFLDSGNPEAFLFQPRRAEAERNRARRTARRTPLTPSQRARRPKKQPNRAPGVCYTDTSYAQSVARACVKAGVKLHPYQLRHGAKQRITRVSGLDAARAVLGQRSIGTTNLYASQQDVQKAAEVMARLG